MLFCFNEFASNNFYDQLISNPTPGLLILEWWNQCDYVLRKSDKLNVLIIIWICGYCKANLFKGKCVAQTSN